MLKKVLNHNNKIMQIRRDDRRRRNLVKIARVFFLTRVSDRDNESCGSQT